MSTTIDTGGEVRDIDTGAPPQRYARGWHCLGLARDFADGTPHQVAAFGTELVVFAGEDGTLNVLDAFCRHMGGNLALGTVKGNTIACPFHDWRWRGDGKCAGIPYAKRVPPIARTRAWTSTVVSGQLFVWHDPQGSVPPPELAIPEIPTYGKNVFEGHIASQVMRSRPRADAAGVSQSTNYSTESQSDASYFGPSYMIDKLWSGGRDHDGDPNIYLVNCHYPISPTSFRLQYGVLVEKPAGMADEQANQIAQAVAKGVAIGFEQDVQIWNNKSRIDNPLLCEEDGPVYQLRRWYEQFYVDVEDIAPEMVNRFEYQIDTERALKSWQAEVDENLAAGRSALAQNPTSTPNREAAGQSVS